CLVPPETRTVTRLPSGMLVVHELLVPTRRKNATTANSATTSATLGQTNECPDRAYQMRLALIFGLTFRHRPRASNGRNSTKTQSRGSVQPVCYGFFVSKSNDTSGC